jgi:quinol monooxygenase YgiN
MWAQVITARVKDGRAADLSRLMDELAQAEQPGSGLVRSTFMRDDADPNRVLMLVVFESEAVARARERDPRREAGLQTARMTMADIFDGPPEFTDLTVIGEGSGT